MSSNEKDRLVNEILQRRRASKGGYPPFLPDDMVTENPLHELPVYFADGKGEFRERDGYCREDQQTEARVFRIRRLALEHEMRERCLAWSAYDLELYSRLRDLLTHPPPGHVAHREPAVLRNLTSKQYVSDTTLLALESCGYGLGEAILAMTAFSDDGPHGPWAGHALDIAGFS